jgi:hypothetical protein
MAVLPAVRTLLPCDSAVFDLDGEVWSLNNPWAVFQLPAGARFPFRHLAEVWLYTQLVGGLGQVEVAIEFLHVRDSGAMRSVGAGPMRAIEFTAENQLIPIQTVFELRRIPFRTEGVYEFRLIAREDGGGYRILSGETFRFQVLDRRPRV